MRVENMDGYKFSIHLKFNILVYWSPAIVDFETYETVTPLS